MSQPRTAPAASFGDRLRIWWDDLLEMQNPHSLFLVGAAALFLFTLGVDFMLNTRTGSEALLNSFLVLVCLCFGSAAFLLGRRVPQWVGFVCVICFALVSTFFVSPLGGDPSAVATLQELPIVALYLGWFTRPRVGRTVMALLLLFLIVSMCTNPAFAVDGSLGVPSAVQAILISAFCYEVGSFLWQRSQRRAVTDPLTGAFNRGGFMERIEEDLERAQRSRTALSLAVIDFDDFKQLNDTKGHAAGDAALKQSVALWQRGVRTKDVIGRTGGDEFALMFDQADRRMAEAVLLRLREQSEHPWSWGIAQAEPGDSVESLFDRADAKLYAQKRNRVRR